jgi:hypothetical protein
MNHGRLNVLIIRKLYVGLDVVRVTSILNSSHKAFPSVILHSFLF